MLSLKIVSMSKSRLYTKFHWHSEKSIFTFAIIIIERKSTWKKIYTKSIDFSLLFAALKLSKYFCLCCTIKYLLITLLAICYATLVLLLNWNIGRKKERKAEHIIIIIRLIGRDQRSSSTSIRMNPGVKSKVNGFDLPQSV